MLTIHYDKTVPFGKEKKGGIRVLGSPDMKSTVEVSIKMPRRKHPIVYVLQPTGGSAPKTAAKPATGPGPTTAQTNEAKRLYDTLSEHNPSLATKMFAEHSTPYTSEQYQTLIEKLSAEVQAAEGGQA